MGNAKTCLITGSNTGIGKQTAIELAKKGYEIIMLVRDSDKSRLAFNEVKSYATDNTIHIYYADFGSLESVRHAARKIKADFKSLDILINNAGVFNRKMQVSEDDLEMMFAVNYLAPFLLTNMLLPILKKSDSARVINLSSMVYKRGVVNLKHITGPKIFNPDKIYAATKKLINHFTLALSNQVEQYGITVNAVHPGVVKTDVMREYSTTMQKMMFLFCVPVEKGAEAPIYLASSDELEGVTGYFFNKKKRLSGVLTDGVFADKLWKRTEELLKIKQKEQKENE